MFFVVVDVTVGRMSHRVIGPVFGNLHNFLDLIESGRLILKVKLLEHCTILRCVTCGVFSRLCGNYLYKHYV